MFPRLRTGTVKRRAAINVWQAPASCGAPARHGYPVPVHQGCQDCGRHTIGGLATSFVNEICARRQGVFRRHSSRQGGKLGGDLRAAGETLSTHNSPGGIDELASSKSRTPPAAAARGNADAREPGLDCAHPSKHFFRWTTLTCRGRDYPTVVGNVLRVGATRKGFADLQPISSYLPHRHLVHGAPRPLYQRPMSSRTGGLSPRTGGIPATVKSSSPPPRPSKLNQSSQHPARTTTSAPCTNPRTMSPASAFLVPLPLAPPVARSRVAPRRAHLAMTAARPAAPASNPELPSDPLPDQVPVYCYVACSPTRSDYLERVLTSRVYDVVAETPLEKARLLSDRLDNVLQFKREDTTSVKSFKVRGAYNMMAKADPAALARGVVAASAGNHAQGVALAAQKLKVPATIVMPAVTPEIKVAAVRRRGADALLHGDNFDQAQAKAFEIAEREGKLFVPPFDHPDVIAGQGTVGLELIRQTSNMDVVFVPIGGGGLIAGIATVIKRLRPHVKIVGVEPVDADAMYRSMQAGERVSLDSVGTFADGVAVINVGEETFRLCKDLVDEVILVNTDEICAAIKDVFEDTRSILEPAGALAVAGAKAYVGREGIVGRNLVAITSGANTNFDRLRHVSERAEIGEGREAIFAVTIPERPGSFRELISALGSNLNITEFNYRYSGDNDAHVFVGARVAARSEIRSIITRLNNRNMQSVDLTDDEMAKLHIRHLVGGNAPMRDFEEAVFRFEFPERPGALLQFLRELPDGFSITMFHYRNHGADVGRVLVGLTSLNKDSKDRQTRMLDRFVSRLGYQYVREDDNIAYTFFLGKRS